MKQQQQVNNINVDDDYNHFIEELEETVSMNGYFEWL